MDASAPLAGLNFPLDRDGVRLLHEVNAAGEDRLVVTLPDAPAVPVLVTWIPDSGPVSREHTDASGTATLPWPGPGSGVLRIDARDIVIIPLRIDM